MAMMQGGGAESFAIGKVRALVRRPRRDDAQKLLEQIAAHVLPILTQRCFRVRRLQEFFPTNPHLLGMNVNKGVKIYIRLRPANAPGTFFPFEALLETMLHELTHMVHGPHKQVFYKYLDQLKTEMETLMVQGFIGVEGAKFYGAGEGRTIEASQSTHVRYQNDDFAAVLAAQRREQYQKMWGDKGAQRLGGNNDNKVGEPLTGDALRTKMLEAAERRRQDDERCAITEAITHSIKVLGIDDSDKDSGPHVAQRTSTPEVVDLVEPSEPHAPVTSESEVVFIDLVDSEEEETLDVQSMMATFPPSSKKRKLDQAADTIDLTD